MLGGVLEPMPAPEVGDDEAGQAVALVTRQNGLQGWGGGHAISVSLALTTRQPKVRIASLNSLEDILEEYQGGLSSSAKSRAASQARLLSG